MKGVLLGACTLSLFTSRKVASISSLSVHICPSIPTRVTLLELSLPRDKIG